MKRMSAVFLLLASSAFAQTPLNVNFTANAALTGTTSYASTAPAPSPDSAQPRSPAAARWMPAF